MPSRLRNIWVLRKTPLDNSQLSWVSVCKTWHTTPCDARLCTVHWVRRQEVAPSYNWGTGTSHSVGNAKQNWLHKSCALCVVWYTCFNSPPIFKFRLIVLFPCKRLQTITDAYAFSIFISTFCTYFPICHLCMLPILTYL